MLYRLKSPEVQILFKKNSYNIKNCVYLQWNNLSYLALETTNYINDLKILRFKLQERGVGPKLYSLQYIRFSLKNGHIITFFSLLCSVTGKTKTWLSSTMPKSQRRIYCMKFEEEKCRWYEFIMTYIRDSSMLKIH